jgi:hypothetical protein
MVKVTTDIDIDFADRDSALAGLLHVPASRQKAKHPTGVYFQNVPTDPITTYCSMDYEIAGDQGYFKIDFLNNSIYADVRDEEHLISLMEDPDWDLFEHEEIVSMLAHIHDKFGLVSSIRPRCVEDLAVILALMRPGKRHLIGKPRAEIDAEIWQTGSEGYQFRRSHAIAYSVSIVVQLNLLCEKTARAIDEASTIL